MNKNMLATVLAAALSCLSAQALATPITLGGSVANGSRLVNGNYAGQFDGSGLLPAYYQINSASFSFTFSDDSDYLSSGAAQMTSGNYTPYVFDRTDYSTRAGRRTWTYYERTGSRTQLVKRTGQQESASLSLGGLAVASGATEAVLSSSTAFTPSTEIYDLVTNTGEEGYYSCGNRCSGYGPLHWTYYVSKGDVTTNYETTDWTGGFTLNGTLSDKSILDQFLATNLLQYSLAIGGDLNLVSSQLALDITELAPPVSGEVPEPSTLLLTFAALGALGYSRRRSSAA